MAGIDPLLIRERFRKQRAIEVYVSIGLIIISIPLTIFALPRFGYWLILYRKGQVCPLPGLAPTVCVNPCPPAAAGTVA